LHRDVRYLLLSPPPAWHGCSSLLSAQMFSDLKLVRFGILPLNIPRCARTFPSLLPPLRLLKRTRPFFGMASASALSPPAALDYSRLMLSNPFLSTFPPPNVLDVFRVQRLHPFPPIATRQLEADVYDDPASCRCPLNTFSLTVTDLSTLACTNFPPLKG